MRSREQIIADCEARFQELQAEKERRDADRRITHPCTTCRFITKGYSRKCVEPLVKGFGDGHTLKGFHLPAEQWVELWKDDEGDRWDFPKLCGPEKALWQPIERKTCWQRFLEWLGDW